MAEGYKTAGLEPGGTDGYFQPIAFESRQLVEERSRLAIVRGGKQEPIVLGDAAIVNVRVPPAREIDAPLAFAGYGLSVPEAGYDDLEGVDLTGRIAVVVSGGPSTLSGPVLSHASSVRWAALHRAGAIGLVTIQRTSDIPWERTKLRRLMPVKALAEDPFGDNTQQLALTVNPAAAEGWFAGSGHTAAEILSLATEQKPLPRFPLSGQLRGTLVTSVTPLRSDNVIGMLRGTDPQLAGEHLVLSAHLDHLGTGEPVNGDAIYNGAMDNASGTATLLEVARRLRASGVSLRRSVVFLSVTAEEHGLLGSRYFSAHSTVPASSIVADLNTDMFLPLFPMRSLIVNGLEESDLANDLQARREGGRNRASRAIPSRNGTPSSGAISTASSAAASRRSPSKSAGRWGRRSTPSSSAGETSATMPHPTISASRLTCRRPRTSRGSTLSSCGPSPTATRGRAGTTPAFSSGSPRNEARIERSRLTHLPVSGITQAVNRTVVSCCCCCCARALGAPASAGLMRSHEVPLHR